MKGKVGRPKGSGKGKVGRPKGAVSKSKAETNGSCCGEILAKLALNQVELTNKFNLMSDVVKQISLGKEIIEKVQAPDVTVPTSNMEGQSISEKLDTINL